MLSADNNDTHNNNNNRIIAGGRDPVKKRVAQMMQGAEITAKYRD